MKYDHLNAVSGHKVSTSSIQNLARGAGSSFIPPFCPNDRCTEHILPTQPFYARFGYYRSQAELSGIQRFRCKKCRRTFSATFFSLEYRQRGYPSTLNASLFRYLQMGSSVREIGRKLGKAESTLRKRYQRMARYALLRHTQLTQSSHIREALVYDGLENFAKSQYDPNQIQQLIGKDSLFIYDFNFVPLNRKGKRSDRQLRIEKLIENEEGRYDPRAIRTATAELFRRNYIRRPPGTHDPWTIYMDRHFQYARAIRRDLSDLPITPIRIPSTDARTFKNHLFAVNHADLIIRQRLAAFTRETISFCKTAQSMIERYILFMVDKNYIRPQFVKRHKNRPLAHIQTPAMAAGVTTRPMTFREFFGAPLSPQHVDLNREWGRYYLGMPTYSREKRHI